MKTFKLYLCIILFTLPFSISIAGNKDYSDNGYLIAMEKTLIKLDSAKTVNDLQQCKNTFERISLKYTKKWLAIYYIAYSDIQMVYFNAKAENNETILADAKTYIDKLSSFNNADKSEVNTLLGYYYNALIMLNPEINGQKYYNDVIGNYEKAIELNPENPRPVFLLAFFEDNLPPFLRSKRVFCEEISKTKELYRKEQRSIEKPYWGKYFFNMVAQKCNK